MPVAPITIDLAVNGVLVKPIAFRWVQSICDSMDTIEIQSSNLALKDTSPFAPVTCTIGGSSFLGYAKGAVINLPTGLVTILARDAVIFAQDYFELGNLVAGVYTPISAFPLSDVAYWFSYWCTRMNIPYEAAADTGRVVPEDKTWQFVDGVSIFRELTSYAGQGYQVKADELGVLHLIKYSNVPNSGDLPASIHTERTVSDEWTRNETVVYWRGGVVDLVNPASDVPPTLFKRRAILSSIYIGNASVAYNLAASLLAFYARFMDVWTITAVDLDVVFEPGIALGGKLLISNITTFNQGGAGLVQELVFDRFCPNMWGGGVGPSFDTYYSTIVTHLGNSRAVGLHPYIINPIYTYKAHGFYLYSATDIAMKVSIYRDGTLMAGSTTYIGSNAETIYSQYAAPLVLAPNHNYQVHTELLSGSIQQVWVGLKYAVVYP